MPAPVIIYRTTDVAQWGTGKGANLQPVEFDQNNWNIAQAIQQIELLEPNNISSITVSGNTMKITMTDGTIYTFALPTATMKFTGAWLPNHQYYANDMFTATGGLYWVNRDHISDAAFNPNHGDVQGTFATLMFPFPNVFSVGFSFPGAVGFGIEADEYEAQAMFSYRADREFYLPATLEGSVGGLFIQAAAAMVLPIMRNMEQIGAINIAAAAVDVTFDFLDPQQFMPGDVLRVLRPMDLDSTAKDLTVTFHGTLGIFEPVS